MTIILDHVVALLTVALWFAAAIRRTCDFLVAAVLATLARVVTVMLLADRGWWFVQEKVLLGLPLLGVTGAVAVLAAWPRLRVGRPRLRGSGAVAGPWPRGGAVGGVVSVFTAAYAALAGVAVTFVVGYPLTAGTALIAVSLVGAAALLTARVVAPPAETRVLDGRRAVSRRRFLGWTGGAVVAGGGTALLFLPGESVTAGGGSAGSSRGGGVSVARLRGAGPPAPGGSVRRHVLTAKKATVRLPSGREFEAWTFNGEAPGPAITAIQGDVIEVRLRNADIPTGVTLHWHGYDLPCGEDGAPGVTQQAVRPGEEFVYRFRADQVGTYWYHTHHASHIGVRKGLYGTLVVKPRATVERLDLTLPLHTFDGTLVIAGRTGHAVQPGTPVRLRLINTDSDPHRIVLAGTPYRVAAVDGRDLNRPGEVKKVSLRLPAGGRYDLVFRMPDGSAALIVDDHEFRLNGAVEKEDTSDWPELDLLRYGTPAAVPFNARNADRHFTMVLDRGLAMVDGRPAYAQTVNGRGHPHVPDQLVAEGDIVRFTVVNRSLETHPWHLHGHSVLVLSRDGTPSTGSPLWVDTFDVRPGEKWEVAFRATNPGIWMNHCHNLPHAHQGMMLRLRYDGVTTPFSGKQHHAH